MNCSSIQLSSSPILCQVSKSTILVLGIRSLPEGARSIVGHRLASRGGHVGGGRKLGFNAVAAAVHGSVLVETSVVGGERHLKTFVGSQLGNTNANDQKK